LAGINGSLIVTIASITESPRRYFDATTPTSLLIDESDASTFQIISNTVRFDEIQLATGLVASLDVRADLTLTNSVGF
jgi:hypothetical protein